MASHVAPVMTAQNTAVLMGSRTPSAYYLPKRTPDLKVCAATAFCLFVAPATVLCPLRSPSTLTSQLTYVRRNAPLCLVVPVQALHTPRIPL